MSRTSAAIFFGVLALVVLSLWSLSSALMLERYGSSMLRTQVIAVFVGFVGLAFTLWSDYRWFNRLEWIAPLYVGTLVLLGLLLVPGFSPMRNGARRWISLKVIDFQPSEVAKCALILTLSWFCARYHHRLRSWRYGLIGTGAIILPVLALIFFEPDRGTTLFLALVSVTILLVAGIPWTRLFAPVLAVGTLLGVLLASDPLVRQRLAAYWSPKEHKSSGAFQNRQARLAFGQGGLTGKGPGAGTMMHTIPERHTDFILPVVGEELGLIGSLGVVLAYGILLAGGASIAQRAAQSGETFGMLLATGITFLICTQAFFNIGIVTGMFPNKGLPLPFVSRGGSNTLILLCLTGFLLSIDRHLPVASLATVSSRKRGPQKSNPFGDSASMPLRRKRNPPSEASA